LRME